MQDSIRKKSKFKFFLIAAAVIGAFGGLWVAHYLVPFIVIKALLG